MVDPDRSRVATSVKNNKSLSKLLCALEGHIGRTILFSNKPLPSSLC